MAGEVRTLAQRSATAAKEIKDLIGDSVNRVDAGSKLVGEASSTIDEIVQSVKRVSDIVSEIASASQEQSTGIEQVNTAVSQMDKATQQNAALVEEASAAAQSMADQSRGLREAVAVFKTAETERLASRAATSTPEAHAAFRAASKREKKLEIRTERNDPMVTDTGAGNWETF